MDGLLGKKMGMAGVFTETGELVPVTVLEVGPCYVTDIRSEEKNGYDAVQIGFKEKKEKRTTKPLKGQFERANTKSLHILKEFMGKPPEGVELGSEINADFFKPGDVVSVTSKSKGKGSAGVVKRHKFAGGPKTHGQSDRHRTPGSIGASATPSRVFKGMRMAGQMGNKRVTVKNLRIVRVNSETNIVMIKGAIPGANGSYVEIRKLK